MPIRVRPASPRTSCKASWVENPPTTGEGTYTFSGDKAFATKMVMQTVRNGKPETMTMEGQGKWLSADCGAIKPAPH